VDKEALGQSEKLAQDYLFSMEFQRLIMSKSVLPVLYVEQSNHWLLWVFDGAKLFSLSFFILAK